MLELTIDGRQARVTEGTTVAGAISQSSIAVFRRSITGETRGPLCGMGICFECRVTIDGVPHCRACMRLCRSGMDVRTDAL